MKKYAQIIDLLTFMVAVGLNDNLSEYYLSIGFLLMDILLGEDGNFYIIGHCPKYIPSKIEYDRILLEHIKLACNLRGYTKRLPDVYINSTNLRWKQDAIDFILFRDKCMLYAFEILNKVLHNPELCPTIKLFKENLPVIKWTIE